MKLINLSLIIIFSLSTNLFSWHYSCFTNDAKLLFIDTQTNNNILKFDYEDIHVNYTGDNINIEMLGENMLVSAYFSNNNYNQMSLELRKIKGDEQVIEFDSNIILKSKIDSMNNLKRISVKCISQKVIY